MLCGLQASGFGFTFLHTFSQYMFPSSLRTPASVSSILSYVPNISCSNLSNSLQSPKSRQKVAEVCHRLEKIQRAMSLLFTKPNIPRRTRDGCNNAVAFCRDSNLDVSRMLIWVILAPAVREGVVVASEQMELR